MQGDTVTFYTLDEIAAPEPGPITRNLRRMAADFQEWNRRNRRSIDSYDRRMAFICPEAVIEIVGGSK